MIVSDELPAEWFCSFTGNGFSFSDEGDVDTTLGLLNISLFGGRK